MERLTIPNYRTTNADGSVTTRRAMIDGEAVREHAWELYDRLKKYENTCFDDPDENTSREVISLDRLRELAEADRDGRVVVLPIKQDALFYALESDFDGKMHVREYVYDCGYMTVVVEEWGKTAFATKSEASDAIAEKGELHD